MKPQDLRKLGDALAALAAEWPSLVDAYTGLAQAKMDQATAESATAAATVGYTDLQREHATLKTQMEKEQEAWAKQRGVEGQAHAAELQAYREKVEGDLAKVLGALHAKIAQARQDAEKAIAERDAARHEAQQSQEYLTAIKAQLANIKVGIPA